ncbi:hypothetical protein L210DRAFT_3542710 [Boletus edulis BED1]|uniref:Uncharacterized protein n=1 Tax=Boletus edulis BED1 TaxID=1328754 RepID=A0AAD4BBB4_BOLED|nr:hypothetical protein L210DRAFT_3581203 [Boletus edulis BED1]KAF8438940.1 hypothetical protein L210DRAFT_3542710 [Boletus edulis BED1]
MPAGSFVMSNPIYGPGSQHTWRAVVWPRAHLRLHTHGWPRGWHMGILLGFAVNCETLRA